MPGIATHQYLPAHLNHPIKINYYEKAIAKVRARNVIIDYCDN